MPTGGTPDKKGAAAPSFEPPTAAVPPAAPPATIPVITPGTNPPAIPAVPADPDRKDPF
jgi:hypothetical protein